MQALLLLSSYGIKSDFENHKKIIKSNIKYIKHLYEFKRFSIQMADVMVNLLIIVEKI